MELMGNGDSGTGCYLNTVSNPNDIWKSESVVTSYLPHLAYQVIILVFGSRFIYYVLRPLNQPRLVADLLAGVLLSSEFVGAVRHFFFTVIVPIKVVVAVTTISHVGLVYYVFLTGLEMNLDLVLRAPKKKATTIAIASTIVPMALGSATYVLVLKLNKGSPYHLKDYEQPESYFIWSLVLSVTGFPVLANILVDLKILYTGLGKLALAAATINDFYNWLMFALLVPFTVNGRKAIYSVSSTIVFILFCYFVIRPQLEKIIVKKTNKQDWNNYQLSFVIMGVFACAAVTDILGTNPIVGALVYGLVIPRGRFADMLIEKSDDFGSGYLAPLFFVSCGLRFSTVHIMNREGWLLLLLIVLLSCTTKIISTVAASFFYGMPLRESVALGVLMNTKGILSFVVLNVAWDKKILRRDSFSIMVLAILIMTMVVSPIINAIYRPRKLFEKNKLRTIQNLKADTQVRILACVHNTRHAAGMVNVLEALSGTNVSTLRVSALQLVELKGRGTALVSAHIDQQNSFQGGAQHSLTQSQEDMETITKHFQAYAQQHDYNRVDTSAVVSSFATINRDIYNLAEEKQASLVLLPFHKHSNSEGTLEATNTAFSEINQHVMKDAPCSVGIFVDRGLGSLLKTNLHVIMLFIGGPDDREALAIAWRMSRHQRIQLTMVRILLSGEAAEGVDKKSGHNNNEGKQGLLSAVLDKEKQKELDEEYVSSFRLMAVSNEDSISYAEKQVQSGDDIPRVLNEVDQKGYDLYILGQGKGWNSMALSNMLNWADCPELGAIGDIVASNSFGSCSSVLVVQQYGYGGMDFGTNNNNTDQPSSQRPSITRSLSRFL